jgi:hypothetical protein
VRWGEKFATAERIHDSRSLGGDVAWMEVDRIFADAFECEPIVLDRALIDGPLIDGLRSTGCDRPTAIDRM